MNWQSNFKKGKEIILSTSSKNNIPNANIVVSLGFIENKLLIADCQMKSTIKNLKENNHACIIGGYFRIKGKTRIFSSGRYFDLCAKNNIGHKVKNAILITIKEVFDLDQSIILSKF
jgi:TATA-box binding protein (TBP) (component of TFIID and TFIIIB)